MGMLPALVERLGRRWRSVPTSRAQGPLRLSKPRQLFVVVGVGRLLQVLALQILDAVKPEGG